MSNLDDTVVDMLGALVGADGLPNHTLFPDEVWSEAAPLPSSPQRIVLGELIGSGGMGEVWQAEQPSLHRQVAVKFVRADCGLDLQRRFSHEARITAALSHPNILPVHDLVEWEGRLGLVMKLVSGTSWGEHLALQHEQGQCDLGAEVQTLIQVSNAVIAAHERGVVHLDIKPDNVLLGMHGEVLLADWGCAAIYQPSPWSRDAGLPQVSSIRQIVGTPAFMAPEQASLEGVRLGPKTDVFLLGAALYRMLEGKDLRSVSSLTHFLDSLSDTNPPRFTKAHPPRLLALCQSCLSPDPGQRPASATHFRDTLQFWLDNRAGEALLSSAASLATRADAADASTGRQDWSTALQLYSQALALAPGSPEALEGIQRAHSALAGLALADEEPGLARTHAQALPPGPARQALLVRVETLQAAILRSRRAQRLVRSVVAGATVLGVAGVVVLVALLARTERERQRTNAAQAFTADLITAIDPDAAKGLDNRLLLQVLQTGEARLNTRAQEEPLLAVSLWQTLSTSYDRLGLEEDAARVLSLAEEALEIDSTPELRFQVALRRCEHLLMNDHEASALETCAASALAATEALGPADTTTLKLQSGALYAERVTVGVSDALVEAQRDLLDKAVRQTTRATDARIEITTRLAGSLSDLQRYEEAQALLFDLLDEQEDLFPDAHLTRAKIRQEYAMVLMNAGDREAALEVVTAAEEEALRVVAPQHPIYLNIRFNHATVLSNLRRFEEAEQIYTELLTSVEEGMGSESRMFLVVRRNLGNLYVRSRRPELGVPLLKAVYLETLAAEGPAALRTADLRERLAVGYRKMARYDEAEALYRTGVFESAEATGLTSQATIRARLELANFLQLMQRSDEALEFLHGVHADAVDTLGPGHESSLFAMRLLVAVYVGLEQPEQARPFAEEELQARLDAFGQDHRTTLLCRHNLAAVDKELGNFVEAEAGARAALAGRERVLGPSHYYTLTTAAVLGQTLASVERHEEAVGYLQRAAEGFAEANGPAAQEALDLGLDHARSLVALDRTTEARALLEALLRDAEADLGDKERTAGQTRSLAELRREQQGL